MEKKEIVQSDSKYWDSMVEEFDSIYSGNRWSKMHKFFSDLFRKDIFDRVRVTVDMAKAYKRPIYILDIGCGTGRLTEAMQPTKSKVIGIDYSPLMLKKAKEILQAKKVPEDLYRLILGDVVNGWADELNEYKKFEVIAMLGLVEYISDPLPLLQKMLCFSPDKIVVTFCRKNTYRKTVRELRYKIQGLDCPLFFYSEKQIQDMGTKLGAKKTTIETMGALSFTVFHF